MNDRMIELYKEASEFAYKICREEGREGGTSDHIWNTLSTGKFAELIVRECAQRCEEVALKHQVEETTYAAGMKAGAFECATDLKQHFGVKE